VARPGDQRGNGNTGGEATLDVWGAFSGEAIRVLILFAAQQITAQLAQEIGSQFTTRIEGTCVKHRFSNSSIKIYVRIPVIVIGHSSRR
jgi:hypothetical protein